MKWIVLVIALCLGAYTWLTLHYRKANPAFAPYADMKDRANTVRLLSAGFQRISLPVQEPADPRPLAGGAGIIGAPGGLPEILQATLVESPLLPTEYSRVTAAPAGNSFFPYPIQFTCLYPDQHVRLAGAKLYLREDQIFIVPEFEELHGDLLARNRENVVLLTVPAGALRPGDYHVTLLGAHASRTWTLQVH